MLGFGTTDMALLSGFPLLLAAICFHSAAIAHRFSTGDGRRYRATGLRWMAVAASMAVIAATFSGGYRIHALGVILLLLLLLAAFARAASPYSLETWYLYRPWTWSTDSQVWAAERPRREERFIAAIAVAGESADQGVICEDGLPPDFRMTPEGLEIRTGGRMADGGLAPGGSGETSYTLGYRTDPQVAASLVREYFARRSATFRTAG